MQLKSIKILIVRSGKLGLPIGINKIDLIFNNVSVEDSKIDGKCVTAENDVNMFG